MYVNGEESPSIEDLMVRRAYWTGDKRFGSVAERTAARPTRTLLTHGNAIVISDND